LKLYTTLSCNNMHLFDAKDKLRKFDSVPAILDAYFGPRLALYHTRKAHQLAGLAAELRVLSNRVRYLQETLAGTVDLRRRTHDEVTALLVGRGYDALAVGEHGTADFKYLTKMPMDSVTQENVERLVRDHASKELAHAELLATSAEQLWSRELEVFCEAYSLQARVRAEASEKEARGATTTSKKEGDKKEVEEEKK
jgi:DNA topoisomerase-2